MKSTCNGRIIGVGSRKRPGKYGGYEREVEDRIEERGAL